MPVSELSALTWEEVRDLDRLKTIAILPVGAIEAHGPHLPLETDVIIAESMARRGAEKLAEHGYEVVTLPAIVYTAAPFAAAFPGTISLSPETVTATVLDIASGLASQGVGVLAIANAHLDPAHLGSISAAVERARRDDLLTLVFPDLTRKPWALELTDEFKSGACHAGQYETSVVMAARPGSIREEIRRGLEANPASLSDAFREGKTTFAEADGPRAYFGFPAQASAEEGEQTVEALGSILERAVLAEIS